MSSEEKENGYDSKKDKTSFYQKARLASFRYQEERLGNDGSHGSFDPPPESHEKIMDALVKGSKNKPRNKGRFL